jgi:hypothetical protein
MTMSLRTALLAVHIAAAACWLGADVLVHVIGPRLDRESNDVAIAWTRAQVWMHDRYYAVVAVVSLATGVWLVIDGDWSWSSGFIWVGVGAIVLGASLGGGGLGSLTKRRLAALTDGDTTAASEAGRRIKALGIVVTLLPIVTIVAMVGKWGV